MATEQLEILREFPFEFYGETYHAYLGTDRNLYLRVADISESMGLDYPGQLRRIKNSLPLSHRICGRRFVHHGVGGRRFVHHHCIRRCRVLHHGIWRGS